MIAAVCVLGTFYCLGGLHGLWLGWTHYARMTGWSARAIRRAEWLIERAETHRCICGDSSCQLLRRTQRAGTRTAGGTLTAGPINSTSSRAGEAA